MGSEDNLADDAKLMETDPILNPVEPAPNSHVSRADENSESGDTMTSSGSFPSNIFVYREDVVKCSKYEGLLGVVMEVAGDSDSEGSLTDDSESEDNGGDGDGGGGADADGDNNGSARDDDKSDCLPDGQVRIMWIDGSETTDSISDITVVDRGFFHGDIVSSASDPTGQLGLVLDVCITVDLLGANGEVIKNVSSKDLKPVREFAVGDYVVQGPWLGRVDDVLDNVTVLFDDGSVCKVVKADPLRLKPVSKPVIDDTNSPYYPGQRVRAVSSSVFKTSRWLSGLWKANRLEGTVTKVQTASVVVYWIASAYVDIGTNSGTVPSEEQNPKDLTLLSCFSYANWQLGNWCFLPSSSLPFSSPGGGMSKASKPKEPIEGSKSHGRHHTECYIGESTNVTANSGTESSCQDMDVPDKVYEDHLSSKEPNLGAEDNDEIVNHGLANRSDSHDINFQPQSCDLMRLHKTTKPGENNGAEPNEAVPEIGSSSSSSTVARETTNESWPAYRKKLRKVLFKREKKARRRDETFERALFVVNTVTKVNIAWQDGTREYGLDSRSLIPITNESDHEFFPEQYVVENVSHEDDDSSEMKRIGVVRSVNSKDRTVCVRWLKPVSRPEDSREFDCDEVVSAYELDEHPDYDYCYGDVVVRLSPVSVSGSTAIPESLLVAQEQQTAMLEEDGDARETHSGCNKGEQLPEDGGFENFTSLSWVGNITGLQDGDIEVTWADGMVSKVGPQAVYVVGRDDDGDSFDGGSEVIDDGASWETVDENEMDIPPDTEKEADSLSAADDTIDGEKSNSIPPEDNHVTRNGPLSMPLAALGFVTRLATGLFSRGRKESDSDHMDIDESVPQETGDVSDEESPNVEYNHVNSNALDNHMQNGLETSNERSHVNAEVMAGDRLVPAEVKSGITEPDANGDHCTFNHFDVAENPLDHYFLGGSSQGTGGRKWVKKVQQEWSILEKNLPDAIYVRVFEDRMDLFRAVIVGACGTPYQDGLFFFDFHLSPEYPQVPPTAYYHSGGLRINPNLYVDGKVCLSLLNTWTGRGNEVWDPSSSSILQVLVSLQGLVLNSKPYFNEAGYEKQVGTIEGEKNSLPYNENTYLLNLKSMLYLLRRPPMYFEGFVKDHFRRRGHYILKACEAYMDGCLIGSLTKDASMTEKSKEHLCSVGFKLMLAKILPRLISAFSEIGVDCQQFEYLQKSENLPRI